MQPVLSDAVSCFKALVTIHKLLVNGPPVVLAEAVGEVAFLEQCARVHGSQHGAYGYGPLISSYASFLLTKIDFHRTHPEFTGNFDYEEYLSIKGVQNLDEGYKTIDEMMELQERLDLFQRSVFENFGAAAGSVECRVSAFVPLIDESYGMYKFVTSMLSAMHLSVESPDPLVLLVERYNRIFFCLKEFYGECSKIKYLTSLVAIPQLPVSPPQFTEEALKRFNGSQAFHKAKSSEPPRREPSMKESSKPSQTTVVVQVPAAPAPANPAPMPMAMGYPGMYDPMLMQRITTEVTQMQQSLSIATAQHQADQAALAELKEQAAKAEGRARELTNRYNQLAAQANNQGDELREQIAQWKRKYETTAKLYTELRERYLQLSNRLTEASKSAQYSAVLQARLQELESGRLEDSQRAAEREAQLAEMEAQLATARRELEELRIEETVIGGEIESQLADEMARAAAEIATAEAKLRDLRSSEAGAVHEDLCDAVAALTSTIAELVRTARLVQEAIVEAAGTAGDDLAVASFYKRNSVWTAGLISAAQAVAGATTHLVGVADDLLRNAGATSSPEHLIVASTGVTAATAQLIAAARVKANPSWSCSEALEAAAKSVGECNRSLVQLVTSKADKFDRNGDGNDNASMPMSAQEWKIAEMNQQVEILSLERRLQAARMHLSRLRQSQYSTGAAEAANEKTDLTGLQKTESFEFNNSSSTLATTEDNELPSDDAWLLTAPPTLEELKL